MKQLSEKLDLIFGKYDDISSQFSSDTTIQGIMTNALYGDDQSARMVAEGDLSNKLKSMVIGLSGVENLNLIPVSNKLSSHVLGTGKLNLEEVREKYLVQAGSGRRHGASVGADAAARISK